ncbi:unnamed protein product, partial [Choristocarpus tenellus]
MLEKDELMSALSRTREELEEKAMETKALYKEKRRLCDKLVTLNRLYRRETASESPHQSGAMDTPKGVTGQTHTAQGTPGNEAVTNAVTSNFVSPRQGTLTSTRNVGQERYYEELDCTSRGGGAKRARRERVEGNLVDDEIWPRHRKDQEEGGDCEVQGMTTPRPVIAWPRKTTGDIEIPSSRKKLKLDTQAEKGESGSSRGMTIEVVSREHRRGGSRLDGALNKVSKQGQPPPSMKTSINCSKRKGFTGDDTKVIVGVGKSEVGGDDPVLRDKGASLGMKSSPGHGTVATPGVHGSRRRRKTSWDQQLDNGLQEQKAVKSSEEGAAEDRAMTAGGRGEEQGLGTNSRYSSWQDRHISQGGDNGELGDANVKPWKDGDPSVPNNPQRLASAAAAHPQGNVEGQNKDINETENRKGFRTQLKLERGPGGDCYAGGKSLADFEYKGDKTESKPDFLVQEPQYPPLALTSVSPRNRSRCKQHAIDQDPPPLPSADPESDLGNKGMFVGAVRVDAVQTPVPTFRVSNHNRSGGGVGSEGSGKRLEGGQRGYKYQEVVRDRAKRAAMK